ncbi:hypothetical protein [Tateyamaria sp. Alg231-49]|uniref:hypothetical protein n=1 Tax=Tateyamaria sp. Alg231-49 TaxID=1922219 RepID=UPI0019027B6F|nr:hypothetical protein [Tateyamaria sp. Alg231-49]
MDAIAKIPRACFVQKKPIKQICREPHRSIPIDPRFESMHAEAHLGILQVRNALHKGNYIVQCVAG